jgi:hypothetical protein
MRLVIPKIGAMLGNLTTGDLNMPGYAAEGANARLRN